MRGKENTWRVSPPLVALLTTLLVIGGLLFVGWLNARRYRVKARVEIGEPMIADEPVRSAAVASTVNLPDGEVARTAARVREATALLLGMAMTAVTEQMNSHSPTDADALLQLLADRTLLPPGMRQTQVRGTLSSERATIQARYRPVPLSLEVVSVGQDRADGLPVIVRLAAGGDDKTGAVLLMARKADAPIPEPFAPLSQIIATGWGPEPLRERAFTPEEIGQLDAWRRQYKTTGKQSDSE